MTLIRDIVGELIGMFLADARLSGAIAALVALAALITKETSLPPLVGGALLLGGCLSILVAIIAVEAASCRRNRSHAIPGSARPGQS
jgi:hypothetical protein